MPALQVIVGEGIGGQVTLYELIEIRLVEEDVFATFVHKQVVITVKARELEWKYVLLWVAHRDFSSLWRSSGEKAWATIRSRILPFARSSCNLTWWSITAFTNSLMSSGISLSAALFFNSKMTVTDVSPLRVDRIW